MEMKDYLWLISLLPAIGAVLNLLFWRFLRKPLISFIACASITGSFILSVITLFQLLDLPATERVFHNIVYSWFNIGALKVNVGFLVDPLSIIMLLVVSGVGAIIHFYSIGYMADDKRYGQFFAYLNLFAFSMLLLVSADNLLLMFVGWEGVGLCSYLLIGFWFQKMANAVAGMKAFIVNRIGDFGFAIGIFILFWAVGTIGFTDLPKALGSSGMTATTATIIALFLFMGAAGKSAQIPLYIWLPDAMAGPTPVSALIHAATMVTAGIYLLARMHFLFLMAPVAMGVVAVVAVATAFYAGTIALVQNDIKRVLAYSTISQLGYMFLGLGVGAFFAGIFHLMTHAFFKALLFLGAGSVMHGTGNKTDIRLMGGLKKYMPITFFTFLIGTLAIAGIPLFSGFFSKDEILWQSFSSVHGHWLLWLVAVAGAGLTALYMFRLVFMTFFGKNRDPKAAHAAEGHGHGPAHESPAIMTVPLIILAVLSVIGGYVGIPYVLGGKNHIEKFMHPVFEQAEQQYVPNEVAQVESLRDPEAKPPRRNVGALGTEHAAINQDDVTESDTDNRLFLLTQDHETHDAKPKTHDTKHGEHGSANLELLLMVISVLVVLIAIFTAYYLYILKPHLPGKLAKKFGIIHKLLLNKYYIDEIYHFIFIKNIQRLFNFLAYKIDLGIIDWLVNASGKGTIGVSRAAGWTDNKCVDGAVNGTAKVVLEAGSATRQIQTGQLKTYLSWVVVGIILLAIICGFFIL